MKILFVCTHNACRSVLSEVISTMEHRTRQLLAEHEVDTPNEQFAKLLQRIEDDNHGIV